MNDDGYTAVEALAAVAIIGLALGGLMSGIGVIGQAQSSTTHTVSQAVLLRTVDDQLVRLFRDKGPFRSDDAQNLTGDAQGFSFACGARRCGAKLQTDGLTLDRPDGAQTHLRLPKADRLAFAYIGALGPTTVWPPPAPAPPAPAWQVLQAITVSDMATQGETPVIVTRLWTQQAANCEFDAITQDCRRVQP